MNLGMEIKQYINNVVDSTFLKNLEFVIFRKDGLYVFEQWDQQNAATDTTSVGVLLAGVTQATAALTNFVLAKKEHEVFRMSFETSSKGAYILPVELNGEGHYLAMIYTNELNPGQLKSRLRNFVFKMESYFVDLAERIEVEQKEELESVTNNTKENQGQNPFADITDSEMDDVFLSLG